MTAKRASPEKRFQRKIVETLEAYGYETNHTFPLMTEHGWRTGTTAKGWPDLTALRIPRILAIEVKDDGKYPPPEQRAWLTLFSEIPSCRAWCLRPSDDWDLIVEWIRRPANSPRVYGFRPTDLDEIPRVLARHRTRARKAIPD